jgi:scyllo-inositol 2-dehydrogenase (NADP+)
MIKKVFLNTAVTSYGMSGAIFHAPFLLCNPHFRITKILERSKQLSKEKIPYAQIVKTFEDILNDPEIDLVVVNTPNELHFPMCKASLANGKHVIVEKPFTNTVGEAEELIELAKNKGLILAVYQSKRLEGDFKTVKKILDEKILGDLKIVESQVLRWKPDLGPKKWKVEIRPGAGLLYDLGSHLIDQALSLFGLPHSVSADLRLLRENAVVDDYFELQMDYINFKVNLKSSLLAKDEGFRFIIHGDKGSFTKFGSDSQESRLMKGLLPNIESWGKEDEKMWGTIRSNQGDYPYPTLEGSYQDFFENVFQSISNGSELLIKPNDALNVIRVIEIAKQSFTEKRTIFLG